MAQIQYGRTWWGKQWLGAFNGIDESNRLPRGRTYANTGRARDVEIKGSQITAKVQGSQRRPYSVTISLNGLTKAEKQTIRDIVVNSPAIMAQLANKQLSETILAALHKAKITLFPSSWRAFRAHCSCPDGAMPCKHIAAVIYLVAAEIDKNPFTVFTVNDCNLLELIGDLGGGKLESVQRVPAIEIVLAPCKKKSNQFDQKILDSIDLSHIPQLNEQICMLLQSNPLFYHKNFRDILDAAYKHWQRIIIKLSDEPIKSVRETKSEEESVINLWGPIEQWQAISLEIDGIYKLAGVQNEAGKCFQRATSPVFALIVFLNHIPNSMLPRLNPELRMLHMISLFTRKLIEQGAFMPQILQNKEKLFFIRWVPALFDPTVQSIHKELESICPAKLVTFNKKKIHPHEQIQSVISLFLNSFVSGDLPSTYKQDGHSNIGKLFFGGQPQRFDDFSTKEIPETINLWLSRLSFANRDHKLYVAITEKSDGFSLELQISEDNTSAPISMQKVLAKKNSQAKLNILSDVALLGEYIPKLESTLETGKKPEYSLEEFGPVFLHTLPLLRALGITVMLPKSLHKMFKPTLRLQVSAPEKISNERQSFMNLENLLEFDWQIAIGNKKMGIAEFKKLLKSARGLVKIKDQFVLLNEKDMGLLLKQLDSLPEHLEHNDLMHAALSGSLMNAEVALDKQLTSLFDSLQTYKPVAIPDNIRATLRPYQERGFSWLVQNIETGFGSIIADDMGLGKTVQVIAAIQYCKNAGLLADTKVLIVAPTSLLTNWQKEVARFAPTLRTCIYHGTKRKFDEEYDVLITSYGLARRDSKELSKAGWFLLVIDEAQNIKNPQTEQTKAIKTIKAKHKIAMSGTPVENRLLEYWSIFDFTNKNYLGTARHFTQQFAGPIERDRDKSRLEQFNKITGPFILRRLKSDKSIIQDLPDKIEKNQYCSLTAEQTALYEEVVKLTLKKIELSEGIERKGLVFSLINSLKQICNHPSQYGKKKLAAIEQSGKLQALVDLMADIEEVAEKSLIFTQYTEMGEILAKILKQFGLPVPFLHGGLTRKQRDQIVHDFQNTSQVRTLIVSLKAGGTGLNLTAANHVIHYDLWWNPAVEAQATDRAYRIGQQKNVMVHRLLTSREPLKKKLMQ